MTHPLNDPQVKLLLSLRHGPRKLSHNFRPLVALIEHSYVRPRHVGTSMTSLAYELTADGSALAQSILEERAATG